MLDKLLGDARETIKRVSDAEAEARKLDSERETVRTGLTTAKEDARKLRDDEHTKASEVAIWAATLQGMKQNFAAVCFRLDTALAPVFPDWRQQVSNIGATFEGVCRNLVEQWRECRKRIETADAEISRRRHRPMPSPFTKLAMWQGPSTDLPNSCSQRSWRPARSTASKPNLRLPRVPHGLERSSPVSMRFERPLRPRERR